MKNHTIAKMMSGWMRLFFLPTSSFIVENTHANH